MYSQTVVSQYLAVRSQYLSSSNMSALSVCVSVFVLSSFSLVFIVTKIL